MKVKSFIVFIMIFTFSSLVNGQHLSFYKERIEIKINTNHCIVKGIYHFKNSGSLPVIRTIFYPFSDNYNITMADSIRVYDLSQDKPLSFTRNNKNIFFELKIPPDTNRIIEVTFSQNTPDMIMEYILLTTKQWKRPLEKAEYVIKLNSNFILKKLSIDYDYKSVSKDFNIYYITKTDFMPEQNLLVKWENRK